MTSRIKADDIRIWINKIFCIDMGNLSGAHATLNKWYIRWKLEDYFPGLIGKGQLIDYMLSTEKYKDTFPDGREDAEITPEDCTIESIQCRIDDVVMLIEDILSLGI